MVDHIEEDVKNFSYFKSMLNLALKHLMVRGINVSNSFFLNHYGIGTMHIKLQIKLNTIYNLIFQIYWRKKIF